MEMVVRKPKDWLKPPRHCHKRMSDAELIQFGENVFTLGMFNPVEALPDGEIISGYHRWLASLTHPDIIDLPVRIISDPITAKALRVRRLSENLQRSDLLFHAKWEECRGFREDEPGITAREIAAVLNVDPSTVTRYLCLDDCIDSVRQAAMENRVSMKACYEISQEPHERQAELLAEALTGGAGRVVKARKKSAGTAPATARASKIKVVLGSGIIVTIGGNESLSLEEAIAELAEALSEMRKAEKQGLDAKTFMAVCRDRAKAGV